MNSSAVKFLKGKKKGVVNSQTIFQPTSTNMASSAHNPADAKTLSINTFEKITNQDAMVSILSLFFQHFFKFQIVDHCN